MLGTSQNQLLTMLGFAVDPVGDQGLDYGELSTPLSTRNIEVNVGKIWMKNKMNKGMKISLPLRADC